MKFPIRRILLFGALLCACIFALSTALSDPFRQSLFSWLQWGGVPAFFVFSAAYNVWIIPFPYDVFLAATPWLYAGQGLYVLLASVAALPTAAALGYLVGKQLKPHAERWFSGYKAYPNVLNALEKYGAYAIALSAVTPLPFSLVSWACGMAGTRFWVFIAVATVTRGLRNFFVWVVVWGMI